MNAATLTALQLSIEHWTRLATGKSFQSETPSGFYCELCKIFWIASSPCWGCRNCNGCPVMNRTEEERCLGTPYTDAALTFIRFGKSSLKFLAAASLELAFLKTLLPEHCHPPLPSQVNLPPL